MYDIITRNIDTEVSAACRRYGLGIVTYNAVGGGLFSGNIRQGITPEDGRLLVWPCCVYVWPDSCALGPGTK